MNCKNLNSLSALRVKALFGLPPTLLAELLFLVLPELERRRTVRLERRSDRKQHHQTANLQFKFAQDLIYSRAPSLRLLHFHPCTSQFPATSAHLLNVVAGSVQGMEALQPPRLKQTTQRLPNTQVRT